MVASASVDQSPELGLAAVAHLSRYRETSRQHTESDLSVFFERCRERQVAPLAAQRHDLELYLRWLRDVRRFKPSTVSRRLSVVAGFYRTCVIDSVLEHSPADYVRRPSVPPASPTLGLTHLQYEAMLTSARVSTNPLVRARLPAGTPRPANLRGRRRGHRWRRRGARAPGPTAAAAGQGQQSRPGSAAACRQPRRRPGGRRSRRWSAAAQPAGCPDGPACRDPATAPARGRCWRPPPEGAPPHAQAHVRDHHA